LIDVYIKLPKPRAKEGSGFTATVYFRNAATADTPTTARYRIDCLKTGVTVRDWTTLTPSTSISVAITSDDNAIQESCNANERKQLTVEADTDLSTQVRNTAYWEVDNIRGV